MTTIKLRKDAQGNVKASFTQPSTSPKVSENAIQKLVPQALAIIDLFKKEDVTCQSSLARTKKARELYKKGKDLSCQEVRFWLKRSKSGELLARLRVEGGSGEWHTTLGETWASCTCPDAQKNSNNVCKHLRALTGLVLNPPEREERNFKPVSQVPSVSQSPKYPYDPTF